MLAPVFSTQFMHMNGWLPHEIPVVWPSGHAWHDAPSKLLSGWKVPPGHAKQDSFDANVPGGQPDAVAVGAAGIGRMGTIDFAAPHRRANVIAVRIRDGKSNSGT